MASLVPEPGPVADELYFVLCEFGHLGTAYVETDPTGASRDDVVRNFIDGEYRQPLGVSLRKIIRLDKEQRPEEPGQAARGNRGLAMTRPANRPRTFEEVKAAQDPAETARLTAGETFSDAQGTITLFADRHGNGDWRVEWFDDDGGCYVTIFAGEAAEQRSRAYFGALKSGLLKVVRVGPQPQRNEAPPHPLGRRAHLDRP